MTVLALASTKGGVGKTTLSAALAVEAGRKGKKVAVIDLDPQQSLARWHDLREDKENPYLDESEDTMAERVEQLESDGYDLVVIDTPPAIITAIEPGIQVADLVLIPVRPSPVDVEAIGVTVDLATEFEKDFVFVLNDVQQRSKLIKSAEEYLVEDGIVLDVHIVNRQAYAGAMISGHTAPEREPKGKAPSAAEISALWVAIEKHLTKLKRSKRRKRAS